MFIWDGVVPAGGVWLGAGAIWPAGSGRLGGAAVVSFGVLDGDVEGAVWAITVPADKPAANARAQVKGRNFIVRLLSGKCTVL
ncbi:hypothetical protein D3C71_1794350 [compost metagenome]